MAREKDQFLRDLREVCATPAGKRVLWRIISWCRPFQSTFRRNAEMGFLEGQRVVGLRIISALQSTGADLLLEVLGLGLKAGDREEEQGPQFVNYESPKKPKGE